MAEHGNLSEIREALLALFLDAEQMAVNGYTTWTGEEWVFNDGIWRENEPEGFKIARRARRLLSLKSYRYRGQKPPGKLGRSRNG